jgi:hypothetical protein
MPCRLSQWRGLVWRPQSKFFLKATKRFDLRPVESKVNFKSTLSDVAGSESQDNRILRDKSDYDSTAFGSPVRKR